MKFSIHIAMTFTFVAQSTNQVKFSKKRLKMKMKNQMRQDSQIIMLNVHRTK